MVLLKRITLIGASWSVEQLPLVWDFRLLVLAVLDVAVKLDRVSLREGLVAFRTLVDALRDAADDVVLEVLVHRSRFDVSNPWKNH